MEENKISIKCALPVWRMNCYGSEDIMAADTTHFR